MTWFQTANFATLAQSVLKEAQKTIDKALDIRDEDSPPDSPADTDIDTDTDVTLRETEVVDLDLSLISPFKVIFQANEGDKNVEQEDVSFQSTSFEQVVTAGENLMLYGSATEQEDAETKWSTIDIETIETSHSRNSSISTLPESNSTPSPEREMGLCRNVYVSGQCVPVLSDHSTFDSVTENIINLSEFNQIRHDVHHINRSEHDGDLKPIVENDIETSNSSSGFEHISMSATSDPVLDSTCSDGNSVQNNSHISSTNTQLVNSANCNKLVTKVKTTASSASSSDIEVIPLDSEEQTISKILQEAESQTDESCFTDGTKVSVKVKPANPKADEAYIKLSAQMETQIKDKDKVIGELRAEGEKLAKKQLDLTNIVKILRTKEKDQENSIHAVKIELAEKCVELDRIMRTFVQKEGIEQAQTEHISKLKGEKCKLDAEVERLKSELQDAVENCNSMKITMDKTSLEVLETKNIIIAAQREAAEVDRLTKVKSELHNRSETLQKEVDHLRFVVNETQKQSSQREQDLKSQLANVTTKCHQLENNLSDISSEVADATMPLSLEIEKLQHELKNSVAVSSKRESTLQSKISDLEQKLKITQERENSFSQMGQSYQMSVSALESRLEQVEEENVKFKSLLSHQKLEHHAIITQCKAKAEELSTEIRRLRETNESIENDLRTEQTEKKRIQQMLEQHIRNSQTINSSNTVSINGNFNPPSTSASSSTITVQSTNTASVSKSNPGQRSGDNSPSNQSVLSEVSYLDEVFDPTGNNVRSMTPKSFFESFSSTHVMENLHAQLRLREGELSQYHEEFFKNERIRKTLNEEIAHLTVQNQEIQLHLDNLSDMKSRLEEMEKNYNAVLQMYGEKVEEAEELRLDLQDVKKMYKDQIEQLLKGEAQI